VITAVVNCLRSVATAARWMAMPGTKQAQRNQPNSGLSAPALPSPMTEPLGRQVITARKTATRTANEMARKPKRSSDSAGPLRRLKTLMKLIATSLRHQAFSKTSVRLSGRLIRSLDA
jgi:hypothetical protein